MPSNIVLTIAWATALLFLIAMALALVIDKPAYWYMGYSALFSVLLAVRFRRSSSRRRP